jgi:hypothetical protein
MEPIPDGPELLDDNNPRRTSFYKSLAKSSSQLVGTQSLPDRSNLEHQKVISLIISRLHERVKPPTIFEQLSSDGMKRRPVGVDAVVQPLRNALRTAATAVKDTPFSFSDDEEVVLSGFSTVETQGMIESLLDILVLARRQGRDILPSRSVCYF